MPIKYQSREELDDVKYNNCIAESTQSNVYAFSWYLDIVSDQWSALILNDYEAVMPLTWNSKFKFLNYAIQPFFCQQLGLYSDKSLSKETITQFLNKIPLHFLWVDLDLNFQLDKGNFTTRKNYVLDLNKDYSLLYKGYRKDRRKSLRKAEEANIEYKDFNNKKVLIKLYKQEFSHLNISEKYFQVVDKIIDYALENKIGFVRNIFYSEDLICSGFFLSYNKKIYYFFGASNKKGKQLGATTFLIDSVIKEFSDTITTFDFEGSSVSNVASFYKSFGSSQIDYYRFSANAIKRAFF